MFSTNGFKQTLGAAALTLAGCTPLAPLGNPSSPDAFIGDASALEPVDASSFMDTPQIIQDRPTTETSDRLNTSGPFRLDLTANFLRFNCEYPSDVTRSLIICAQAGSNRIFTYDARSSASPIDARMREDIMIAMAGNGSIANHIISMGESWSLITANNGMYVTHNNTSGMNHFIPFPTGFNTGSGAAVIGNTLYVSTGNLDGTNYRPGTILSYAVNPTSSLANTVVGNFLRSVTTPNVNPTGLAQWNDGSRNYLVALCSGAFTGVEKRSSLMIYDPGRNSILRTIPLGDVTASVSGHLALSGSRVFIGTSSYDSSDGVFFIVDLQTSQSQRYTFPGDTFHASNHILLGAFGVLIDFNAMRAHAVRLDNPDNAQSRQTLPLALAEPGPSSPIDDRCLVVVGSNAGVRVCLGL